MFSQKTIKSNEKSTITSQTVLVFIMLFATISFVFSVFQQPKYKSMVRVLVVSKFDTNSDPYAVSRSTEYISSILNRIIYTASFFNEVVDSGFNINNEFNNNPFKRADQWKKMVQSVLIDNTGILEISVLNKDRTQGEQLASAIGFVLSTKGNNYYSAENVRVKIIDAPITSINPVVPNIPLNIFVGALLGLMAGVGFVYLFPEYQFQVFSSVGQKYENFRLRRKKNKIKTKTKWSDFLKRKKKIDNAFKEYNNKILKTPDSYIVGPVFSNQESNESVEFQSPKTSINDDESNMSDDIFKKGKFS